jgi:hypothetical protein
MDAGPDLLAVMEPMRSFLGTWRGAGAGAYPTIEPFAYREEVQFWHAGKPFLGYQQRTRHAETGLPLHAESGFWRIVGPGQLEVVIAHPTGLSEVLTGQVEPGRVHVTTTSVARTPTAKEVARVDRTMTVDGDVLTYEVHMAAVGQPLQLHLTATLHRAEEG